MKKLKLLILLISTGFNVSIAQSFISNGIAYKITSTDGSYTVEVSNKEPKYSGTVVIPNTLIHEGNTYAVTAIGDEAFMDCRKLSKIEIPDNVKTIGNDAFIYCHELATISLGSSLTSIGDNAFRYCYLLKRYNDSRSGYIYWRFGIS
ncbi:leucine-rich repeat domain-containing protein [Carboxylicivirga mesophila]|uniref:Leucine-rich repeat domain-containing protein n=1 Tax=Carboxylicivirga mesophila TaxID=1166478 RepID=A0ABS5K480_9BACT|nr:leucine-rich repeat domain-containing protein [Carboxylicivirga mesophila]MBS2209827.1 leucine-rich repeat domain-containing protein [Carboxylicivirga mesophila]